MAVATASSPKISPQAEKGLLLVTIRQARFVAAADEHEQGEGFGEYFRGAGVAVDWSQDSVDELERRASLPAGTPRRPRLQNRDYYFLPGLTYSVVSGGRLSVRLLPEGWIFGHKGSAIFVENDTVPDLFLLGYLNSALATYFMKRVVNTTATADVGYVERLPFRPPDATLAAKVVECTQAIIDRKTSDPEADWRTYAARSTRRSSICSRLTARAN
jgi:hypothetical protein